MPDIEAPPSLTKVTVYCIPKAMVALEMTAAVTGDSHTDTINRAVQIYGLLVAAKPGEAVTYDVRDGGRRTILVPTAWQLMWARFPALPWFFLALATAALITLAVKA